MSQLGNPLSSEAAAFRWVVVIAACAALVIAAALLTRPWVGAVVALCLVVLGVVAGLRSRRRSDSR